MNGVVRRDPIALGIGLLGLVTSVVVTVATGDVPGMDDQVGLGVVAVFALTIVLGEWFHLSAPGFRGSAPIAAAAAFALALTTEVSAGQRVAYGGAFVLAVTAVAMTLGTATRVLAGREVSIVETTGRFVAIAVLTVLYRGVHLGQSPGAIAPVDALVPWQRALLMLALCAGALLADAVFTSLLRAVSATANVRRTLVEELRSSLAMSTAVAVTGVLVALAAPSLGIAAPEAGAPRPRQ